MRPFGSPEELERRRTRAVALLEDGYQPVEVAHMLGVDRRSVRRWNATYRKKGNRPEEEGRTRTAAQAGFERPKTP